MKKTAHKKLIVSGVNLVEGGTLRVFQNFLEAASSELDASWEIIALVNRKKIIKPFRAKLIEIPWAKKNWLYRIFFEWWVCEKISKRLKADVWFAIHDITPRVGAVRKVVYCHNAMPFYNLSFREAKYDIKAWLFSKFYGYLYGIGIRSNSLVVVQQDWMRREFECRYEIDNVLVAYPKIDLNFHKEHKEHKEHKGSGSYCFVFPSLARSFKNFEVICKAVEIIEKNYSLDFEVIFTIDASENSYANDIFLNFGYLKSIKFIGRQNFEEMAQIYEGANCLIFPSKIETWGLPITEAKSFGLDILAANEKYAHETIGNYDKVDFFDTNNHQELAEKMIALINGQAVTGKVVFDLPRAPFVEGWGSLVKEVCVLKH